MRLDAIFLRPGARVPVQRVERAVATADVGLEGDHAVGGRRQITLLSAERWVDACAAFGREVDPAVRRANLLVSGLDVGALIGRSLRIGDVVIELTGETRPCELMDDDGRVGLCAALRPDRRGGAYGVLRVGGGLEVGMAVEVLPVRGS